MQEYVEINYDSCVVETDHAVLLNLGTGSVWIPKSNIENGFFFDYDNSKSVDVKLWFAEQEELI